MITKQIACQLFAWGYKLVDENGVTHNITGIHGDLIFVKECLIPFVCIGKDYFILARSTDKLCEEIEGKVPISECAKIGDVDYDDTIISYNKKDGSFGCKYIDTNDLECVFLYNEEFNSFRLFGQELKNDFSFIQQQSLFNHLYSLHFAINLPEGSWKEI